MTTSFLPSGKCVILSVLHQQSNILKAWHLINIHRKLVVGKVGGSLPLFHFISSLFLFIHFTTNCLLKNRLKKDTENLSSNLLDYGQQNKLRCCYSAAALQKMKSNSL